MSSIDNRIVKMGFDNAKFEQAATVTMTTLKKLSENLKLAEGVKGLEKIAGKVKSVDMTPLANGVDAVKNRFSALDVVGVTALVNITNSAVNAGKNLVKSLTIDPIKMGFDEYETKMNAITTIMTNTAHAGTTMDQVTSTLNELNTYADKTIYNFAEMTRNIGTFTAAGIDLDTAAEAIKGIANLAAGSGSSAQQASTAMYQLSQAMAAGKVGLQDWNSVVNAGMGGKLFQDALIETGQALGKNIKHSESFRESLQRGWLTTDVLTKTLQKFAADESLMKAATQVKTFSQLMDTMKESVQSGWAQSWEMIFGNKDQATEFFTSISDGFNSIMGPMADYRNEALSYWNKSGGREAIIRGLGNAAQAVGKILGPVYQAFKKIIDPWNGERLVSLSKAFEFLTSKLIPSDRASAAIGKTFEALFSIVKLVCSPLKLLGGIFSAILIIVRPIFDAFVRVVGVFGSFASATTEAVNQSDWLVVALGALSFAATKVAEGLDFVLKNVDVVLQNVLVGVGTYVAMFADKFNEMVAIGKQKVSEAVTYVKTWLEVHKPMEKVGTLVEKSANALKKALQIIQNAIGSFVDFCQEGIGKITAFFDTIVTKVKESNIEGIDLVNAGLFATALIVIKKFLGFVKDVITSFGSFKVSAIGVLDEMKGALEAYQKDLSADLLKKVATGILLLATSLFILSKIDPNRLIPAVAAMSAALAIMVVGVKQFDSMDPKAIKETSSMVIALIGIATTLNILATAMVKLSALNWGEILKATVGLGAACAGIYALTKTLDGANLKPSQGVALVVMAVSLNILAGAMAIIGNLEVSTIQKSLIALGAVVVGLSAFLNSLRGVTNSVGVGASLIPITMSMMILSGALAIFGNMNVGTLVQGFVVLTAALTSLSLFVNSTRGITTNLTSMGVGIVLLSSALVILSGALAIMGNLRISTIAIGLATMGASLLIIANAMKLMPRNMFGMSSSLVILAVGLTALSGALAVMGNLNLSTITKGLLGFAGVLAVFLGAAMLAGPATALLLPLSLGMLAVGAAAGVCGGAMLIVSAGMTTLAGAILASGGSILAILGGIAIAIPVFASSIALAFVSFITIIGYNATALGRALNQLFSNFLKVIIDNIPLAVQAITLFLTNMMQGITTALPEITAALIAIVTGLKDVLVSLLQNVMQVLVDLAPAFCTTLVTVLRSGLEAIRILIPEIATVVMEVINGVLTALGVGLPQIASTVVNFIVSLISTVLTDISTGIPKIASKITDVIVAIISAIGDGIPRVVNAIMDLVVKLINGFANSISTNMPKVRAACKNVIKAITTELKNCISDMVGIGSDIIGGVVRGITNGISKVTTAAKNVASAALNSAKNFLGIHSPSREFAKLGKWSSIGMADGISKYGTEVENEAVGVGDKALNGMRAAMASVDDIMNSDVNSQPIVKPVMDLSEVQNGANSIGGMMSDNYSIKASVDSTRNAASMMSQGTSNQGLLDMTKPSTTNNNNSSISNTFNITGTNAKEIADEVSRIIQQQVERRDVLWA